MRLGNFSVEIPKGKELDSGYVAMKHNTKYALRLSNFGDLRCDAEVEIDSKPVGVWRVSSNDSIIIERPTHDTGCFTFYKAGTREAKKAEVVRSDKLGLISVTFKPEEKIEIDCFLDLSLDENVDFCLDCDGEDNDELDLCLSLDDAEESLEAGGTGLSGKSEQEFHTVRPLDYDETGFVRINLRLVCETDEPRPLTPVSTPIPPPLL
ncbi:hypothetical protein VU04_05685 [Desulfobulbus sp. TB]|nr:hypothetical protein [Desulfobulbus sp. TB]